MLTSTERRHRYAASVLGRALNLVGIVTEAKPTAAADDAQPSDSDAQVIAAHFAERDAAERRILGDIALPDTDVRVALRGEINSPAIFEWVQKRTPHVVVLFGTSIVRPPLLDTLGVPLINVHLGLSPYYRGSGTNFWPLSRGEPECVGATIHLAVRKVDAGPILVQVRPEAERADRAHELGSKTIREAFNGLPPLLARYLAGGMASHPQDLTRGTVFRRADFTADSVRDMWRRFDAGMMDDYLTNIAERRARFPIVDIG